VIDQKWNPSDGNDAEWSPNYSGGEFRTNNFYHYGYYETSMKAIKNDGVVSSFFTYTGPSDVVNGQKNPWDEIDIEILGKDPSKWQSNIITREAEPSIKKNTSPEVIHPFAFDATKEFHLYAIIWTPEYVAWEIDSVEVRRDTLGMSRGTHADADQVKFLTEKESLRFNLWASKTPSWTGKFTGVGLPIEQQIDYVRVYSYDEATKGFKMLWQDDFDGNDIDPNRWTVGDWEMENVMYRSQNIKVQNGVCRIIMDYEAS
jgi:beta-glucanase (GH16 family)